MKNKESREIEKLKKRILNLEQELKEVWQIIRERDNYLFETITPDLIKLEKKVYNKK